MKLRNLAIVLAAGVMTITSCDAQKNKKTDQSMEMKNEADSVSYALGVNIGTNIKGQGFDDINADQIAQAIKDVYGDGAKMDVNDAGEMLNAYMMEAQKRKAEKNLAEGEAFLAENGKRDGVNTTASGLQYEVIKEGTGGPKPTPTSQVKVHYHGTLLDGTVFDSSVDRGQPATFGVNQVIPGWTEALQLMSVGDKFKLYLPSKIAYQERGAGGQIGPNTTLIFEVELLEVM